MSSPPEDLFRRIEEICDRFEAAWKAGRAPRLEDYVGEAPEEIRRNLFPELVKVERFYRPLTAAEAAGRFGGLGEWVQAALVELALPQTDASETAAFAPRQPAPFRTGDKVARERYLIVAKLGEGGMGEVYRAHDLALEQTVALKFLPRGRADDPEWKAKLREEVRLAQAVSHPCLCRVHDLGEHDGRLFLSMEFVGGGDLAATLSSFGRSSPEKVAAWAAQLCDGLTALHERGLLHRDLKPANVLLDARGNVRLADFGLAAVADRLQQADCRAGTLAYQAPEQLAGRGVSERSDLFSLGLVLYELTTGVRPFAGRTADELKRQHNQPPKAPSELAPGVDPALDRTILRCLAIKESDRFASALEVKQSLGLLLSPRETQKVEGSGLLRPRVALGWLAAALLLLALHAGLAPWVMLWHKEPLRESPADLAHRARRTLQRLGHESHPDNSASAFAWDLDRLAEIRGRDGPDRWAGSPVLYFWYREGPQPLEPFYRLTPADPPLSAGMTCVILDTEGDLLELRAVSDEKSGVGTVGRDEAVKALFEEAYLNLEAFEDAAPEGTPPVYADERRAWSVKKDREPRHVYAGERRGKKDHEPRRVEAAWCKGRVVWFLVQFEPPSGTTGSGKDRLAPRAHNRTGDELSGWGAALLALELLGGAILAWHNLALGRADVRGAWRVGLLCVVCHLIGWLSASPLPQTAPALRNMLIVGLGTAAYWVPILAVAYLALEPSFRRRWPQCLSSWNRLVAGDFGDPLVGADVLRGVTAGLVLSLLVKLAPLVDRWRGIPSWQLKWFVGIRLAGPDVGLGCLFTALGTAVCTAFLVAVLFLVLTLLLRREWLAVGATSALFVSTAVRGYLATYEGSPCGAWPVVLWCGAALIELGFFLVLWRLGVLTSVVGWFTGSLVSTMPVTLRPAEWYAATDWLTILLVVGLAAGGARIATGGRPWREA
jgi:serine/threonine-protein kinase